MRKDWQAKSDRWMDQESDSILYLDGLEGRLREQEEPACGIAARAKAKESDQVGSRKWQGICI